MEKLAIDSTVVLGKALAKAQEAMGVDQQTMADILGVSRSSLRRHSSDGLSPESNPGRIALVVVRIYRAVYALTVGDLTNMRHWFSSMNRAFNQSTPLEAMANLQGLIEVD